jgi:hypothetical protein
MSCTRVHLGAPMLRRGNMMDAMHTDGSMACTQTHLLQCDATHKVLPASRLTTAGGRPSSTHRQPHIQHCGGTPPPARCSIRCRTPNRPHPHGRHLAGRCMHATRPCSKPICHHHACTGKSSHSRALVVACTSPAQPIMTKQLHTVTDSK